MLDLYKNGKTLNVAFSGHLDTAEAEADYSVLDAIDEKTEMIVFDMEKVDYISSSALRLLLTVRKRFPTNECVRIINCNETVYNVIEAAGFHLMMNVLKNSTFDISQASWKDILAYRAANTPDFVFITYGDKNYTWKEIDVYSQIVAHDLALHGVKPLSHIGITGANSVNYIIVFFALQKLGAIAVLINDKLKDNEIASECVTGDVGGMCIGNRNSSDAGDNLKNELSENTDVGFTYDFSDNVDFSKRKSEYESIKHLYKEAVLADIPSLIIFSSGSTGKPKAVLLSTYNLVYNGFEQIERWQIKETDCICLSIPLFHIYGFKVGFAYSVILNYRICIPKDMHTSSFINMIERERCTLFPLVPTMLIAVVNNREFTAERIKSVRIIPLAGAALPEKQMLKIMELLPNVRFINLYGLSEMTPLSSTAYADSAYHICKTVGKPFGDVEVKIVKPNNTGLCRIYEQGEILVRGKYSFLCYYKCPAEAQCIDGEGFVHTGDLGYFDGDGYLYLSGRIKDIIIRGGENILPAEISEAISIFDNIKEVAVMGIPDDFYGEAVGACISLKDASVWDCNELNRFLSGKVADYKIPVIYELFNELPKLGNGKQDMEKMKKILTERRNTTK